LTPPQPPIPINIIVQRIQNIRQHHIDHPLNPPVAIPEDPDEDTEDMLDAVIPELEQSILGLQQVINTYRQGLPEFNVGDWGRLILYLSGANINSNFINRMLNMGEDQRRVLMNTMGTPQFDNMVTNQQRVLTDDGTLTQLRQLQEQLHQAGEEAEWSESDDDDVPSSPEVEPRAKHARHGSGGNRIARGRRGGALSMSDYLTMAQQGASAMNTLNEINSKMKGGKSGKSGEEPPVVSDEMMQNPGEPEPEPPTFEELQERLQLYNTNIPILINTINDDLLLYEDAINRYEELSNILPYETPQEQEDLRNHLEELNNAIAFIDFTINERRALLTKITQKRDGILQRVNMVARGRKGGSNSTYTSPPYSAPPSFSRAIPLFILLGMGGGGMVLSLIAKYGIPAVREIITNTAHALGFRGNRVGIEDAVLNQVEEDTGTELGSIADDPEGAGRRKMKGGVGEPGAPYVEGETDSEASDDEDDDALAQPHVWNGHAWVAVAPQPPMEEPDFENEVFEGQGRIGRGRRRGGGLPPQIQNALRAFRQELQVAKALPKSQQRTQMIHSIEDQIKRILDESKTVPTAPQGEHYFNLDSDDEEGGGQYSTASPEYQPRRFL
jgi:hypothetical protein